MAGRLFTFTDPVLFIQGDCDKESDLCQTQMVYEKVASREKDLEVIEGSFHEPFLDHEKDKYQTKIVEWLRLKIISGKPLGSFFLELNG